jgi:hypothetical protein
MGAAGLWLDPCAEGWHLAGRELVDVATNLLSKCRS